MSSDTEKQNKESRYAGLACVEGGDVDPLNVRGRTPGRIYAILSSFADCAEIVPKKFII